MVVGHKHLLQHVFKLSFYRSLVFPVKDILNNVQKLYTYMTISIEQFNPIKVGGVCMPI